MLIKSSSSSSRFDYQVVFIIKSFSSSRSHQVVLIKSFSSSRSHQVVLIKSFSSNRSHHQAVLIIKSYYQAIVASQFNKSIYQVILSSHSIKSYYQVIVASILWDLATIACYGRLLRSLLSACYDLIKWLDKMTW
jgi:hypothetical protein